MFERSIAVRIGFILLPLIIAACSGESVVFDGSNSTETEQLNTDEQTQHASSDLTLYSSMCANCHGPLGVGASGGRELYQCDMCDDELQLRDYILDYMPVSNPGDCGLECSSTLAKLIVNNFEPDAEQAEGEALPTADASASVNLSGLAPLTTFFDGSLSIAATEDRTISEWVWQIDNGNEMNGRQLEHTFTEAGTYRITLTVTDSEGLTDSDILTVRVFAPLENQPPVARATASTSSIVVQQSILFDAGESSDDQGISEYLWDFGEGNQRSGETVEHTFNVVGSHTVTLTVTDLAGEQASVSLPVSVSPLATNTSPEAIFNVSSETAEAPVTIAFDASLSRDDGSIVSYTWELGDSTSASGQVVEHIYTQPGEFTVRLFVEDDGGLISIASRNIEITAPLGNEAPTAVATLSTERGILPLNIRFDSSESTDDKGIQSVLWQFGDGNTSTEQSPSHTYTEEGVFSGTLTVTDSEGLQNRVRFNIRVQSEDSVAASLYSTQCAECHGANGLGSEDYPALTIAHPLDYLVEIIPRMPPDVGLQCQGIENCEVLLANYIHDNFQRENTPPRASIAGTTNIQGNAPLNVSFVGNQSTDDHGIVLYSWTFGDGTRGEGETIAHAYASVGNYAATLTVFDEEGLSSSATVNVNVTQPLVNQAPIAVIETNRAEGEVPLDVRFSATRSADDKDIVSWRWDLGDGTTSNSEIVNHRYTASGTYTAQLTVADAEGLEDTTTTEINVTNAITDVATLYQARCAECHGRWGEGGTGPLLTNPASREEIFLNVGSMLDGSGTELITEPISCSSVNNCQNALTDYILNELVIDPEDGFFACSVDENKKSEDSLRRLSVEQLNNVYYYLYETLTGRTFDDPLRSWVHEYTYGSLADQSDSGFAQMDQRIFEQNILSYMGLANQMAFSLRASDRAFNMLLNGATCDDPGNRFRTESCRRAIMENGVDLIFRRPATQEEIDFYTNIDTNRGDDFIRMLFMSPAFLFHMEFSGSPDTLPNNSISLTPYEIASRLSFLFWNSTPDRFLLDAAANGDIENNYNDILEAVIGDARTEAGIAKFYEGWLRLDEIPSLDSNLSDQYRDFLETDYAGTGDTAITTRFDVTEYRDAALREIHHLTHYYTFATEGSLMDLFTSPYSFADQSLLATAYGVDVWNGGFDESQLVQLPENERSGLLTRSAFLLAEQTKTRPVIKGVRIRKDLLCDEIPAPNDNSAPPSAVLRDDQTQREHFEALTEIPGTNCADCHVERINPLGFALEGYDPIGRYRERELVYRGTETSPLVEPLVNDSVIINIDGESNAIDGGVELSELLAGSPKVDACFARKLFQHTFARYEDLALDGCLLNTLAQTADQQSLLDVFRALAQHPDFKRRALYNLD